MIRTQEKDNNFLVAFNVHGLNGILNNTNTLNATRDAFYPIYFNNLKYNNKIETLIKYFDYLDFSIGVFTEIKLKEKSKKKIYSKNHFVYETRQQNSKQGL